MDDQFVLAEALGYVRHASGRLAVVDDPSGESLFLIADCLDVESTFVDQGVVPAFVACDLSAVEALMQAAQLLEAAAPGVPSPILLGVQSLLARAGAR